MMECVQYVGLLGRTGKSFTQELIFPAVVEKTKLFQLKEKSEGHSRKKNDMRQDTET